MIKNKVLLLVDDSFGFLLGLHNKSKRDCMRFKEKEIRDMGILLISVMNLQYRLIMCF